MLQPHTINVKIKTNGVQRYIALLNEIKPKYDVLKRTEITRVNAHDNKDGCQNKCGAQCDDSALEGTIFDEPVSFSELLVADSILIIF